MFFSLYMSILFAAFSMGFLAGITPGPLVLSGVGAILTEKSRGFFRAMQFLSTAVGTEFFIVVTYMTLVSFVVIPEILLHGLSVLGSAVLLSLAWTLWKKRKTALEAGKFTVTIPQIVGLTFFNPALWIFWTTVSIPLALELEQTMKFGKYYYILAFLGGIFFGHTVIFGGAALFKRFFLTPKFTKMLFPALALCFFLFGIHFLWKGGMPMVLYILDIMPL